MAKGTTWKSDIAKDQMKDEAYLVWQLEYMYKDALEDCKGTLQKLQNRIANEGLTPSLMNQVNYQNAIKQQIEGIYNDMYGTCYNTVADYLKQQYEGGLLQSMYSLHSQGLNISVPIDQNEIALMSMRDTSDGMKLSTKLYQNTYKMANMARDEITRGLITQASYADIARNLEKRSQQSFNKTYRIARTEGHRANQQARMQAMGAAKEKGADVVKQWDSTLDGRTRETHRQLDGQVREIDGKFKVGTHEAFYPGGFGIPGEDIHCRCTVLERPRWALDDSDDVTKWDGENGELLQSQAEIDLWKDANEWTNEKGNKYNQFKKAYKKKAKQASQKAPDPVDPDADSKKLDALEDELADAQDELSQFDLKKKYEGFYGNEFTIEAWENASKDPKKFNKLQDIIDETKQIAKDNIDLLGDADDFWSKEDVKESKNILKDMEELEQKAPLYMQTKQKVKDLEDEIEKLKQSGALSSTDKKIKDLEEQLKAEKDELSKFDPDKEYQDYYGKKYTLNDWKKTAKDPKKSKELKDDIDESVELAKDGIDMFKDNDAEWAKNSLKTSQKILDDMQEFEDLGPKYIKTLQEVKDLEDELDKLKNAKKPKLYTGMSGSGGNIDENCTWKDLFPDRWKADEYFRDWADRTTYALGDTDGQAGLYEYTAGSGFMNRPLSGYDGGWSRYNFKGFGNVDWDNERSIGKKSIDGLTKLIDDTEPLKEGVVLVRGSDEGGLAGMFEGAGFSYDDILDAISDGSIKNFEGSMIKNHAFTSCAIADGTGFGGSVGYKIKCPAGTKMVYAEPQSCFGQTASTGEMYKPGMKKRGVGYEAEMLLQRGTSFRIDKITKKGGRIEIEMTVVDQNYD